MDLVEQAKELGNAILATEQAKNLADATALYEASEEAQAKMEEYRKYQEDVQKTMQSGEVSKEDIHIATQRLTEMATELKQDPIIGGLVFAENEFNGYVNQIMTVVKNTIMGIDSSCGEGGCSGCGGGCH